ncbi:Uncharacterized protein Fot_29993 [Forsythia ovata]|uniref:Uncharacterized protein n=1 Tax=Forsythia ovata TaxID=205694 RepID=A0ABD1TTG9_9LAMI
MPTPRVFYPCADDGISSGPFVSMPTHVATSVITQKIEAATQEKIAGLSVWPAVSLKEKGFKTMGDLYSKLYLSIQLKIMGAGMGQSLSTKIYGATQSSVRCAVKEESHHPPKFA